MAQPTGSAWGFFNTVNSLIKDTAGAVINYKSAVAEVNAAGAQPSPVEQVKQFAQDYSGPLVIVTIGLAAIFLMKRAR